MVQLHGSTDEVTCKCTTHTYLMGFEAVDKQLTVDPCTLVLVT